MLKPKLSDASSTPDVNKESVHAEKDDVAAVDQPQISNIIQTEREEPAASPLDFIEEIKQAAENAQKETGFVYEPTSGLYYDCKTGYYYNAVGSLVAHTHGKQFLMSLFFLHRNTVCTMMGILAATINMIRMPISLNSTHKRMWSNRRKSWNQNRVVKRSAKRRIVLRPA